MGDTIQMALEKFSIIIPGFRLVVVQLLPKLLLLFIGFYFIPGFLALLVVKT